MHELFSMPTITMTGNFLTVSFDSSLGDTGDNGDTYTFIISTPDGQPFEINGKDVDHIKLSIVGNFELEEFLSAMNTIRKTRKP